MSCDEASCVSYLGSKLGALCCQMVCDVILCEGPKLQHITGFMQALQEQLETPLEAERALMKLQRICQGNRFVRTYSAEFHEYAAKIWSCPEDVKVRFYQAGLKISKGMGQHWETRSFFLIPTAKFLLVLGIRWMQKCEPWVQWSEGCIWLTFERCEMIN